MKQKTFYKNNLITLALMIFMMGASLLSHAEDKESKVVWIDVRSTAENMMSSIEGDINIPYDEIVPEVTKLYPDKNTEIRVYCKSGGRAQKAMDALHDAGYSHVKNMGGIEDVKKIREIK